MIRNAIGKALLLVALTLGMMGCDKKNALQLKPDSSGRPFEVLLAAEDELAAQHIRNVLEQTCKALPQPEPSFDVSTSKTTTLNASTKMARALVLVETDSTRFQKTLVRYERNVYAQPQIIVHIGTPSARQLLRDMSGASAEQLRQLLNEQETSAEQARLRRNRNETGERMADSLLQVSIMIPKELSQSKRGNRFLWLSNNATQAMRNICLYSYDGRSLDPSTMLAKRDSIMKQNLPGEREGMFMQTVTGSTTAHQQGERLVMSGLWEVKDDMMGGPFTAVAIVDSVRQRIVVAEAFVYAPEQRKRNLMRQLEAALQTFSITKIK